MKGMIFDISQKDSKEPLLRCTVNYDPEESSEIYLMSFGLGPIRKHIPTKEAYETLKGRHLQLKVWNRPKKECDYVFCGTVSMRHVPKLDGGYDEVIFHTEDGIERAIKRISYL